MIRLIVQTQGRLGGFSVLNHLLSPKVKSTLLSTNDLQCAMLCTNILLHASTSFTPGCDYDYVHITISKFILNIEKVYEDVSD